MERLMLQETRSKWTTKFKVKSSIEYKWLATSRFDRQIMHNQRLCGAVVVYFSFYVCEHFWEHILWYLMRVGIEWFSSQRLTISQSNKFSYSIITIIIVAAVWFNIRAQQPLIFLSLLLFVHMQFKLNECVIQTVRFVVSFVAIFFSLSLSSPFIFVLRSSYWCTCSIFSLVGSRSLCICDVCKFIQSERTEMRFAIFPQIFDSLLICYH